MKRFRRECLAVSETTRWVIALPLQWALGREISTIYLREEKQQNAEVEQGCISIVLRNPPRSELHLRSLPGPLQINTGRWHQRADFRGSIRTVKGRAGQYLRILPPSQPSAPVLYQRVGTRQTVLYGHIPIIMQTT